jgi:hypothetical protein
MSHQILKRGKLFRTVVVALAVQTGLVFPSKAEQLRGFGEVKMSAPNESTSVFECENPERALALLHKIGRDMSQSATVKAEWRKIKNGDLEIPALVRPGLGSFLLAAKDKKVLVFTSPKTDDLNSAFTPALNEIAGAKFFDENYKYPYYLDKFSHFGIGSWYPSYWGENTPKSTSNEVDSHFKYARDNGLTLQPNNGDSILRNLLPKLREFDRPYHFALWQEWSQDLARMAPEELVMPNDKFTAMPSYYGQVSDGGRKLLKYRDWTFQNTVKSLKDDPLLVDWLDPNGEVGPFNNFQYWDFSEGNRQNLVRYLKTRNYTPPTLGEAWFGDKNRLKSWDDVKIPMSYEFFGWREGDPVADKDWKVHPAITDKKDLVSTPWYDRVSDCPPSVLDGIGKKYNTADFNDSNWPSFNVPCGELPAIFWRSKHAQFWYRGYINADKGWLANAKKNGRVYMTVVSLTNARGWKNPDRIWVNGKEVANLSRCSGYDIVGQVDVTDLIKEGKNSIVYLPANLGGTGIGGPFLLSTKPMEEFPFSNKNVNSRYRDWRDYISWCVMEKMENTFKAIRGEDPDRFIKMHAAYDKQLGIPLQAKYGCFGHNTGEGGFFRPWDKRFGYPYGVPSSAEFGGGIVTVEGLKRWVGWFTFEGLNAFDNFHNIQEMMYSPAAATWLEYMPYVKLANRRDIKRPDIALLWSSRNNSLLPKPVPYCFDIGRGDLQFIGYSYVDASESTIRDGLVKDYPVIWDTGTWIMDPETVKQLKAYVEEGGTFVALQETGRHSYTGRDAWPISELTGYKVREVRPMTGTLGILVEQPLFKKLAGKAFYNRGKSVDYSDYNYADKCIVLEPAVEGTTPIARYEDGSIAIGMRQLGKGKVIVLGSPFWRDSYDGAGMWWPGESQNQFLEDILDGIGVKPLAKSSSHDIWREHYLANNGTEEYLALFNPFKEPKTFSIEWTTVKPATELFDPKNGQKIEGKIEGNIVKLEKVTLEGLETRIIATQPAQQPRQALDAWFKQLCSWWRPSAPGEKLERPDLPTYTMQLAQTMTGIILTGAETSKIDPAFISKTQKMGPEWKKWVGQSIEEFKTKPDKERRAFLHCPIEVPKSWKPGEKIELVIAVYTHAIGDITGPLDVWLNGQQIIVNKSCASGGSFPEDGTVVDVTEILELGGRNALCITTGPNGFIGEVKLRRYPIVTQEIEISGEFKTQIDADSGLGTATVPGAMKALYGWKDDVMVPANWKNSRVFIQIDVEKVSDYEGFAINDKVIFHPVSWFKAVTWMDITPFVKFGEPNRLTLISKAATREWKPGTVNYKKIKLQQISDR